jgi:hypothetical protein
MRNPPDNTPEPQKPAAQHQPVLIWPTPDKADLVFWVNRVGTLPKDKLWTYGEAYPDATRYPDHKLVYVTPETPDKWSRWYYASNRLNEDAYNWSFTQADIGSSKFDAVERTYLTPRASYTDASPAMGATMPDTPADVFSGTYVLAGRKQMRTGDETFDSLYVGETRTYVRRATLGAVVFDSKTGRGSRDTVSLYYRGEIVSGTAIETLAAAPSNAYWGLQTDGSFRTVQQPSDNWWAVTTSSVIPANAINSASNPAKTRVQERVTPLGTDIIFSEVGQMPVVVPTYGSAHYDAASWPNHKLAFIEPADESGLLFKFWYVADRASQDNYNFKDDEGQRLTRTYVIKRSDYLNRVTYLASLPTVGTADAVFTQYVFAGESAIRLDSPLDASYVGIERIYLPPVKTDIEYDETLERNVVITRTIIPHGSGSGSASPGSITEIQDINTWYDIEISREVEGGWGADVQLATVPCDVGLNLPPKLNSVTFHSAGALADSTSAARSMSEDFGIEFNMTDPMDGPYQGRILRFLTDDPEAYVSTYPQFRVNAARETLFIGRAWFYASQKGNSTHAQAQIVELPRSIHDTITITPPANPYGAQQIITASLAATPSYATIIAGGWKTVGYVSKKAPLDLWIVEITQMNFTGVY